MAYTADALSSKNSFGNLPKSSQGANLTNAIGSNMQSIDNTGTAVNSPISVNGAQTLKVPTNALMCFFAAPTAFDVSEDSTHTAYFTVPANTVYRFDCFRMPNIYLHTGSAISISFQFKMLS